MGLVEKSGGFSPDTKVSMDGLGQFSEYIHVSPREVVDAITADSSAILKGIVSTGRVLPSEPPRYGGLPLLKLFNSYNHLGALSASPALGRILEKLRFHSSDLDAVAGGFDELAATISHAAARADAGSSAVSALEAARVKRVAANANASDALAATIHELQEAEGSPAFGRAMATAEQIAGQSDARRAIEQLEAGDGAAASHNDQMRALSQVIPTLIDT
jgi:hypothetical protein